MSAKPNYSLLLSEDAAWESVNEIRMAVFISPARWRSARVRRNYILIDLFTDRVWDFIFLFSGSAEMSTICLCVRQHPACLGCIWIPHLWLHSSWKHQCGECVIFFFQVEAILSMWTFWILLFAVVVFFFSGKLNDWQTWCVNKSWQKKYLGLRVKVKWVMEEI